MTPLRSPVEFTTPAIAGRLSRSASQLLAVSAVVLLAACASPTSTPTLDAARSSYQQAAGDATVVRSASVELNKAQQALQRAEAALKAGDDLSDVNYYADLAKKRTEVAMQTGRVAAAEQALTTAATQRERILLESRTAEADTQRQRANMSVAQAEQARMQADQARMQAEESRKVAEQQLAAARAAQSQSSEAQARNKALEMQLAEMKAKKTDRGMVLTLGDVLFDTGRAELKSGANRTLDQLTTFLSQNPERTVQIEGYTDSTGSEQTNQVLSERRANAVKNALVDRNVAGNRITARGMGPSSPIATNGTAAGRQQNRRV
ncbi:MAG: OmpA family protein, partial [Rubrivivax sp.]